MHESSDIVILGWISLIAAVIGFILFAVKVLLTKKLLGYQGVELTENLEKNKVSYEEYVKEFRSLYVDLDVIGLLMSCVEDVPQATIVVICVTFTGNWDSLSILTFSKSLLSFCWKLLQPFASKKGCMDPENIKKAKKSMSAVIPSGEKQQIILKKQKIIE